MSEPKRLLEGSDTPRALHDALHALQAQEPNAAAHARISARIAAPPSVAPARSGLRHAWLGLALLGAAVIAWQAWPAKVESPAPVRSSAQPPREPVREAPVSAPIAADDAPRATPARVTALAPEQDAQGAQELAVHEEPAPLARPARSAPRARPPVPARTSAPAIAIERGAPSEVVVEVTEEAPVPSAAPSGVQADAPRELAEPQDEASLLYRARRLASSDPSAALRLIVLHEASFPSGSFGEERDMLEIQIHERLGHRALAQRLAAQFRARYPDSVYRTGAR